MEMQYLFLGKKRCPYLRGVLVSERGFQYFIPPFFRVAASASLSAASSECARCYGYTPTNATTPLNHHHPIKINNTNNHRHHFLYTQRTSCIRKKYFYALLFKKTTVVWVWFLVGVAIWVQRSSSAGVEGCCGLPRTPGPVSDRCPWLETIVS